MIFKNISALSKSLSMTSIKKRMMFIQSYTPNRKGYYHPYNRTPPLQIGYMVSLLKNEYEINFLDRRVTQYSLNILLMKMKEFNPSVIIISSIPKDREFVLEYSSRIKELSPHTKMVCIGPDASTQPWALIFENSPIDFALRGECELDLVSLLKSLNCPEDLKKIGSLYSKEKSQTEIALIEDPDKLPFPEHSLFNPKDYFLMYPLKLNFKLKWGYILSSRGCPQQCLFCSPIMRTSYGSKMRYRLVKNVIEEMLYLKSWGVNIISFEDDNFTASKERVLELCREIINKKVGLPWIAHAVITDLSKDVMSYMKEAGCVLLKVGVESGSNRIINILSKTKEINWNKKVQEVFRESKKINLPLHAMFIIGNPQERKIDLDLTKNLIKKIKPESIQIHYFIPYPGSVAFDRYCHNQKFNNEFHYCPPSINLSNIGTKKLKKAQRCMYRAFFLNPLFLIKHLLRYRWFYLFNSKIIKEGIRGLI